MNYDGILFDLDGTLWDSTAGIYKSWVKVLETLPDIDHIPTKEEQASVMGLSDIELMKILFPKLSAKRGKEVFDLCCEVENVYLAENGGIAYEGITETLEKLSKNHSLAIVSNCNDGYIEAYFASMGTEKYFADFESFGRTGKPKWENIKSVVERNGYKNPVYVGDTIWDMESATKAGVPFIHATYGFGKIDGDIVTVSAPKELIDIL